jgi:hypothetical protein
LVWRIDCIPVPQFDKITFFTQIVWSLFLFFGFYAISVRLFLPRLALLLKGRKKKRTLGSKDLTSFLNESVDIFKTSIQSCSNYLHISVNYTLNQSFFNTIQNAIHLQTGNLVKLSLFQNVLTVIKRNVGFASI